MEQEFIPFQVRYGKELKRLGEIFHFVVPYNPITGILVDELDDRLHWQEGESTAELVKRKYGEEAFNILTKIYGKTAYDKCDVIDENIRKENFRLQSENAKRCGA